MSSQPATFSTLRNPLDHDRVFVFRVTPGDHNLSYANRSIHKDGSARGWNKTPDTGFSNLRAESNIVSLTFEDTVHIYGICAKDCRITLLSPVVEALEPQAICEQGKLAGVTFNDDFEEQAWLIYQKTSEQGDTAKSQLMYRDVTTPENPDTASNAKDTMTGTYLSLFHDTRGCWVVYQNSSGQLVVYNEKDHKPSIIVINPEISNIPKATPIASCFIPAKDINREQVPDFRSDALGRVIVYWVHPFNDKPCLYRSHADLQETGSNADFTEPRQATEIGVSVEPLAQISVISDPGSQSNYLFVVKHGDDNISSVSDKWTDNSEVSH